MPRNRTIMGVRPRVLLAWGFPGLAVLGILLGLLIAPWVSPYSPVALNLRLRLSPPGWNHPFGTDQVGRDVLSRVLHGARYTVVAGLAVPLLAASVGLLIGGMAGVFGGILDEIVMRGCDVVMSLPALVLAMAVAASLGGGLVNTVATLAFIFMPAYARLVRAQVLSEANTGYVEAARAVGASNTRILRAHLLPNLLAPITVKATLDVARAVNWIAFLGFIGLGTKPPAPEWGAMISEGRRFMLEQWWMAMFPGLAIIATSLSFSLFGDTLINIVDPVLRSRIVKIRRSAR